MAEPVRITIPAAVAAFVRPGVPLQERLQAAAGNVELKSTDLIMLLFCLGKDAEAEVRNQATATLTSLPDVVFACLEGWPELHPAVLHGIALACGDRVAVRQLLLRHPAIAAATRDMLLQYENAPLPSDDQSATECPVELADSLEDLQPSADEAAEVDEEGDEYLSKYQMVQTMGTGEKIKMALTGDKEWRKILIKDSNKLVSSGVLKNPRLTEPEVLNVLKSGVQNDEIMRLICANKEWTKNYQIRRALIENPKTPLANALRYLSTMNEKDIAGYAKSRNISSVIATQAKRLLLNKKRQ